MVWTSLVTQQEAAGLPGEVGAAPAFSYSVKVVRTEAELFPRRQAWDDLARNALEGNVFYESWMLLPAIRAFGQRSPSRFVLVFGGDTLCGFFPLQKRWGYKGLPVSYLSLWRHRHLFLGLPLLRAACASDCLHAFLNWLGSQASLLEWPSLGEGSTYELLQEWVQKRSRSFVSEEYGRPLLRRGADAESHIQKALTSRTRKDLRRKERQLQQLGAVEVRALSPDDDVDKWIKWFLQLERSGWKGHEGTALACRPEDQSFFETITRAAFQRGQLRMLGLFLNNQPIALKCNLLPATSEGNRGGCFAFKIAFDETHAAVSPGAQLELANIHDLHKQQEIEWMDSCSAAGPTVFDRIWVDQRKMKTVLMSTGRRTGNWIVSMLPKLRRCKQKLAQLARKFRRTAEVSENDAER